MKSDARSLLRELSGISAEVASGRLIGSNEARLCYLRTMLMQGARVILLRPANWAKHSFGLWLTAAAQCLHHNVLATALANKLARIAWTVLAQGRSYEARVEPKVA